MRQRGQRPVENTSEKQKVSRRREGIPERGLRTMVQNSISDWQVWAEVIVPARMTSKRGSDLGLQQLFWSQL